MGVSVDIPTVSDCDTALSLCRAWFRRKWPANVERELGKHRIAVFRDEAARNAIEADGISKPNEAIELRAEPGLVWVTFDRRTEFVRGMLKDLANTMMVGV